MAEKKMCPQCKKNGRNSEMRLEKRAKPEGVTTMFVAEDEWVCTACGHTVGVE